MYIFLKKKLICYLLDSVSINMIKHNQNNGKQKKR
jgi:hypothetical protein